MTLAKKPIKITEVVLRDAHQSLLATRMTMDEMRPILPEMDKIPYFSVECWGGATFDSCIRFLDEDPWERLRILRKELPHQKLQMLFRGQNMLGYRHYADDAVEYFVQKSVANGIDILRIFDALNDPRNLQTAIKAAIKEKAHVQGCISYTLSPVHNNEYFAKYAKTLEEMGAHSICIKDMAGLLTPYATYELVKALKEEVSIPVDIHSHYTSGLASMSILKGIEAGADIIDTAIEPLSWGKVHPDIISVLSMLRHAGFDVPDINMDAYMKARALTQEFIDEWLGYFINPQNKIMSSLLLTCGLPGGMMGSMMADLGGIQTSINNLRRKKGEKELSTDDLLVKLFDEVAYVWPRVGYPPLVTPFSQYTKNIALLNLLTLEQGKGRFVMMDDSMWGMILGRSGRVPGEIDPVLKEIAAQKGLEFTEADPHTLLPTALDDFRKEMADNGWDCGQDEEELFELAMHPEQYRNYKSGQAKKNFLADLQAAKDKEQGSTMSIEEATAFKHAKADAIVSPVKGQLFWDFQGDGEAAPAIEPFIGKEYKEGDTFCHVMASWGELVEVPACLGGKLVEICAKQGSKVRKGDVIAYIQREE